MVPKSDFESANYIQMFKSSNIEASDITMVEATFNMDDFINKKVDAASIFLTNEPFILNQKNIKYNILDPSNYGVVLYDVNLFTSNKYLNKNPELVKNFIDATNKGWEYAIENYEKIVDLILEKYNTQNKSKEHLLFEAQETIKMMQPRNYPIGSIDMKQITRISNLFSDLGMVNNPKNLDSIVFNHSKILQSKIKLSKEEHDFLKNKKKLNVCINNDRLPFGNFNRQNQYEGIGNDLLYVLSKKIGVEFNIKRSFNMKNTLDLFENLECDFTSLIIKDYSLHEKINYTTPILSSPYVVVSKNSNQIFIENLDNLLTKKFAILKNDKIIGRLKTKYPNIQLIEVSKPTDAFKLILNDEIYAYIDNTLSVVYNLQQSSIYDLKIIGKLKFFTARYSIGVNSKYEVLNDIIEKGINSINKTEIQAIQNKWVTVNIENNNDLSTILKILFLTFTLFLIVVYLNYKLKKQVEKQVLELRKKDNHIMEQARFYTIGQTIGNIAHQWKIPLTHIGTINTSMEVTLKHGSKEVFLQNAQKNIENINNSVQLLKSTLDDFLNFYTTTPKRKEFKPYNTLQNNIIQLLYTKITLKNVDVQMTFDENLVIKSYEYVFANVFMILFDNSMDAFSKDSQNNKITIDIKKDDKNILIKFSDNAGGIKIQPIEKIFDYFVTTKQDEGHGLGLTTVKMLIEERLDGSISVKNENDGASFLIKLPPN